MTRRAAAVAAFSLLSSILWVFGAATAAPEPSMEADFTRRIAQERAAAGVPAYVVADDLVAVARKHSEDMAREDRLHHNPDLGSDVQDWEAVGENVGTGGSVEDIHRAFMASSTHRSEILSTRFTQVGVGVVLREDGAVWVTQVFRRPASAPPPSPTTSSTAPPAPAATAPPTAAPPATTSPPTTATPATEPGVPGGPANGAVGPGAGPAQGVPGEEGAGAETAGRSDTPPDGPGGAGTDASSATEPQVPPSDGDVSAPVAAATGALLLVVGAAAAEVSAEERRRRPGSGTG